MEITQIIMIEDLFLSYIHGVFSDLQKGEKIFISSDMSYEKADDPKFLEDLKEALLALSSSSQKIIDNKLLKGFSEFVNSKIIPVFDKISIKFFIASLSDRKVLLKKVFATDDLFHKTLRSLLLNASNEEAQGMFSEIFKKGNPGGSLVKIQSAREATVVLKNEIRQEYGKESFVVFQVNTRLLGGLLVYKDGKISDFSWRGRVNSLKKAQIK